MAQFDGKLKSNEIFGALYNMIISQETFADNIAKSSSLVDKAKIDGGLYGDTKLYTSTDVLKSAPWGNDDEAVNLLAVYRPSEPKTQAITLNDFRQISLTVDNYLSKRAWGSEGAFSQFNSNLLGWIGDTKSVYDYTTYNAFIGTDTSTIGKQSQIVDLTTKAAGVSDGQAIAEFIANLLTELKDTSRDYNDYGFLRKYDESSIQIIWNSKWVNKINKIDLPTIFHKDNLMDKFDQSLPARYFGTVITADTTVVADSATLADGQVKASAGLRSLIEQDIGDNHYFAGDLIKVGDTATKGKAYVEDANIIAKVYVKLPPYMSAFEVGTSFFNPKSLTENHYLTWGKNTLVHLENYPCITIKAK